MGNQHLSLPSNAKPIPNFTRYYITEDARVFSTIREKVRELKVPYDLKCKYRRGGFIGDDGMKRSMLLHRLVALTFLPETYSADKEVNHKDGNKLNNHVSNLEWVTRTENLKHAYSLELITVSGENNPRCLLKEKDVLYIYQKLLDGEKNTTLAKMFNVDTSTIMNIKDKSAWNFLLKDLPDIQINHKSQKLQDSVVENICLMFQDGYTPLRVLSELEGIVTKDQVYDIKRRKCFKHIVINYVW